MGFFFSDTVPLIQRVTVQPSVQAEYRVLPPLKFPNAVLLVSCPRPIISATTDVFSTTLVLSF